MHTEHKKRKIIFQQRRGRLRKKSERAGIGTKIRKDNGKRKRKNKSQKKEKREEDIEQKEEEKEGYEPSAKITK